jgi:hypothetical protein
VASPGEDTERFVHDLRGFAKDEKFAKVNKAVAELVNGKSPHLGVKEDDTEEQLGEIPEKLMDEELLELEQDA